MPSPHPAVTPAAILIAKKYGKSVSKGIVEMDKRIVVLEYAVPSPLNENQIRTKEIREEVHKVRQEQHDPPKPHKEWIISDVDYHVALEYFHFEARPYIHPPQTPDELFEKCKMLKKKIEADKLEERKMQGELYEIPAGEYAMIEQHNFLCENGDCLSQVHLFADTVPYRRRFYFSGKMPCPICSRDMYEVNRK